MKTKTRILKVFAICAIFFNNSYLIAQTVTTTDIITQTVCINTLNEPYEIIPNSTSSYSWSIIDQSTSLTPLPGVADIIPSANDWLIYIDWTTPGVYVLSIVETDIATLCNSNPIDLTITVENNANFPSVLSPSPICLNDPNPLMTATTGGSTGSGVFNWYADAGLTTLLISNSSTYTDPVNYPIDGTYSYWVTEESNNGCEGLSTQVDVIVTPLPNLPTLVGLPYEVCFGDANPTFTASGSTTNFNWYDAIGNQLSTNISSYTPSDVTPNTYSYYVEEVVGSCASLQNMITFTINPSPASPLINPSQITICEGETPSDFIANTGGVSGSFNWYDIDPVINSSAIAVGNSTIFTPINTAPGTYNYWLTETDLTTTCTSNPTIGVLTVNELPLAPIVSSSPSPSICVGDPNPIFTANQSAGSIGTSDFNWYDSDPTNPLSVPLTQSVTSYIPSQSAVGIYTFWITETNSSNSCEGVSLAFTFEILALPSPPTLMPNPTEICFGDANPAITPIGSNLTWYDDISLINQIGSGATFTPPSSIVGSPTSNTTTSYWVVDQPGNCFSPPLQVDLQINALPQPGPIWHN
tara:strand:- start:28621 stop:30369 length:1749 start_codon:yes stop_codon:yes gene_type:complete